MNRGIRPRIALATGVCVALIQGMAPWGSPPSQAESLPKPSATLLRSLDRFERDLKLLDQTLPSQRLQGRPAAGTPPQDAERELLASLQAPAPGALPSTPQAVQIRRQVSLSLPLALEVAVRNDPDLAEQVAAVRERQGWLTSVRGRFWPELTFLASTGYQQIRTNSTAWQGNEGIYAPGSPFLVQTGGWNLIQQNLQTTESSVYRYFDNKHRLLVYQINLYWGWLNQQVI